MLAVAALLSRSAVVQLTSLAYWHQGTVVLPSHLRDGGRAALGQLPDPAFASIGEAVPLEESDSELEALLSLDDRRDMSSGSSTAAKAGVNAQSNANDDVVAVHRVAFDHAATAVDGVDLESLLA